jgi:hypothetical protein
MYFLFFHAKLFDHQEVFFSQFCDVAIVAIIHKKNQTIYLQVTVEFIYFLNPITFLQHVGTYCLNMFISKKNLNCGFNCFWKESQKTSNVSNNRSKSNIYLCFSIWNHDYYGKLFILLFMWMLTNSN